jgi:general secretion pathway protein A
MYRAFFGFKERPFDLTPNPRFLVLTDGHREALSNLDYGIASRRGITLLIGDAGTGKTTVIRTALERQPDRVHSVHLHNPALTRVEFVEMLAARFHLTPEARRSKTALLLELETLLLERHRRGESTVLIVDEAQSIPLDLLEEIRLLANIETAETKLLSVVLAGQPELATRLNDDVLRQLKQRIALRCELRPLTMTETLGYVAGRIRAAGGVGAQVFTREAVMLIHERSGGIPRTVSVIADNALLTGFALGRRPVGRAIVEEVCRDLDLDRTGSARGEGVVDAETVVEKGSESNAGDPRILTFDTSAEPAAPAEPTPPAPAGEARLAVDATPVVTTEPEAAPRSAGGMFSDLYPKRRLFSFFSDTRRG